MTQHVFPVTLKDGRQAEAMAGWDRPLQGFFLVIEDPDDDQGCIFNNLDQPVAHPSSFDPFEQCLREQGMAIPVGLIEEIKLDGELNLGNKFKRWSSELEKRTHEEMYVRQQG